jgi:tetratricopeptide (TPR) repeat protein
LNSIGFAYVEMSEYKEGLNYLYTAKKINERFSYKLIGCLGLSYIGYAYEKMHVLDSALIFQQQAYRLYSQLPLNPVLESMILTRLGLIQFRLGNDDKALAYYQSSLEKAHAFGDILNQSRTQYRIGELYYDLKQPDSSLKYTQQSFMNAQEISQKAIMLDAGNLLLKLYRVKNNNDSAFYYQEVAMALKDSLFGPEKFHSLQLLAINEQRRQQEIQQAQEQDRNRIKTYLMLAGLVIALLIAFILWINNRNKQKTNILLRQQKKK